MMKDSLKQMRIAQHDINNQLSPIIKLAQIGDTTAIIERLSKSMSCTILTTNYVNTGNDDVDSIINYKLQKSTEQNILISSDIVIPNTLPIQAFDLAIILGNIIDNSLEAVLKVDERWIDIKMKYTKGRLILEVNNSFDGFITKKDNHLLTRKQDSLRHGLGIQSVEIIVSKYNGLLQITHDDKKFKIKLLIYI